MQNNERACYRLRIFQSNARPVPAVCLSVNVHSVSIGIGTLYLLASTCAFANAPTRACRDVLPVLHLLYTRSSSTSPLAIALVSTTNTKTTNNKKTTPNICSVPNTADKKTKKNEVTLIVPPLLTRRN